MHRPVHTDNLPKPVGPYSPGMGFERLIFVSGQGATDPATGELAGAGVEIQTEQCLRNLRAILQAAGSDLQYVLRCGVFLLDMKEFGQMNAVYERDYPLVQGTILFIALLFMLSNLIVDLLYAYLDPRIRYD